ncbi:MAG: OmpA family protein, partial [Desulfamplus sp.]|nr:OmpA family protein [Desulfamplus sp.]
MKAYNKKSFFRICSIYWTATLLLLITGCATSTVHNQALERARSAYDTARTTPDIESNAPVALYDAKGALEKAEKATKDIKEMEHLAYIAEKKAQLAVMISESKASELAITELGRSKDKILIKAREIESDAARAEAEKRTLEAEQKALEAELARKHSEAMMQEAEKSRLQAEEALAQKRQLEQELADLQAKQTDRGAVITLGNILFEVNKSNLLSGGFLAIEKLSYFLKKYPTRNLLIEGHTDSRGSDMYNLGLSQQRANSVFTAFLQRGIDGQRMLTKGYGEQYPVAGNETEGGRQQNRRVEVIILD